MKSFSPAASLPDSGTTTSEAFSPTASEVGFSVSRACRMDGRATSLPFAIRRLRGTCARQAAHSFCFATLHRSVAETAATALPGRHPSVAAASIRARAKYATTSLILAASGIQEPISSSVCE